MTKLKIKSTKDTDLCKVPSITVAKAKRICEFTGLPQTKALGLMTSFVPVINGGHTRNLKNGKKKVTLFGEKGEWNFEI